jgi:hypothetical protein
MCRPRQPQGDVVPLAHKGARFWLEDDGSKSSQYVEELLDEVEELLDDVEESSHVVEELLAVVPVFSHDGFRSKSVASGSRDDGSESKARRKESLDVCHSFSAVMAKS